MEIKVKRNPPSEHSTLGSLFADGKMLCFTLEDTDRFLEKGGEKVPKQTAIPRGRYRVVVDMSERFLRPMPHILNVPHFDGVRIHTGNTAENTEGCIIVGMFTGLDQISDSWHGFGLLLCWMIEAIQKGEEVWITIE